MKRSLPLLFLLMGFALAGGCGGGTPVDSDGTGGEAGGDSDEGSGGVGDDEGTGGEEADGTGGEEADGSGGNGDGGTGDGGTSSGSGAGSGVGGNGGMGGSLGGSDFCEQYAAAQCAWYEGCNNNQFPCGQWPGYQWAIQECADALVSVEQGFLEYHEDVAFGCVEAAENAACGMGPPFIQAAVKAACGEVFAGTVPLAGECAVSETIQLFDECAEGFCVRSAGSSGLECLGVCTAYKTTGEACAGTDRCVDGLYCAGGECHPPVGLGEDCTERACESDLACAQATPITCRDLGDIGADCSDDYDCSWPLVCSGDLCTDDLEEGERCRGDASCFEGLYCQGAENYADQTCAAPLSAGATCAGPYDRCEDGYVCSFGDPSTCVAAYGAENESCGPYGCDQGLWCDPTMTAEGVCLAQAGENGDCLEHYDSCQSPLLCMSDSSCHPLGGLDEPCSVSPDMTCVAGLFCDRETDLCKEPRAEGETCNPMFPLDACQDGLYCACLADGCPSVSGDHDPEDLCALQLENGEYCTTGEECSSAYCSPAEDECADPPPDNCTR